jgi:uncharacterized protein YrrD
MLRSTKYLNGFTIRSTDGDIGKADEFYFDDRSWTIRYLVVDTGNWLISRKVLLSPNSLLKPDWDNKVLPVNLSKQQVEDSPPIETQQPISKQHEIQLMQYYGWPNYWTGIGGPVVGAIPPAPYNPPTITQEEIQRMNDQEKEEKDYNLRSSDEVINYNIQAADDNIGHVEDFLFDDESWQIKYLIVDTKNFWAGKKVIISLGWVTGIEWTESKVHINHTVEQIKNSPEYDPDKIDRDYEDRLHAHYGKNKL